jgi:flagellar hook-length control protein FliK
MVSPPMPARESPQHMESAVEVRNPIAPGHFSLPTRESETAPRIAGPSVSAADFTRTESHASKNLGEEMRNDTQVLSIASFYAGMYQNATMAREDPAENEEKITNGRNSSPSVEATRETRARRPGDSDFNAARGANLPPTVTASAHSHPGLNPVALLYPGGFDRIVANAEPAVAPETTDATAANGMSASVATNPQPAVAVSAAPVIESAVAARIEIANADGFSLESRRTKNEEVRSASGDPSRNPAMPAISMSEFIREYAQRDDPARPSSASANAERVASVRDAAEARESLGDRVVRSIRSEASDGRGEVVMHLDPPHLGQVHVRLLSEDGHVSVSLQASSDEARALFQSQLPSLGAALSHVGLDVRQVSLHSVSDFSSFNPSSSGSGFSETPERRRDNRREEGPAPIEAPVAPRRSGSSNRFDYLA